MNYNELIAGALKGRSVNSMAKIWGVPQQTLDRWVKGEKMPDYNTGLKIAEEAGIDPGEAFKVFAAEERNTKAKNFKLQMGFVQTNLLLLIATCGLSGLVYIMSNGELTVIHIKLASITQGCEVNQPTSVSTLGLPGARLQAARCFRQIENPSR